MKKILNQQLTHNLATIMNIKSNRKEPRRITSRIGAQRRRRGAVTVEMAMTLPVLLLILFGAYEFAKAHFLMHTVQAASYEGARTGMVLGGTADEAIAAAETVVRAAGARNVTVTVEPEDLSTDSEFVRVTVVVPLEGNMPFMRFFNRNAELFGETELRREDPGVDLP